jgi:hypothetical protein
MSKKQTKQSRATACRKARQEAAMERFRKAQLGTQRFKGLGQADVRQFLLQQGAVFSHMKLWRGSVVAILHPVVRVIRKS